MLHRCTNHRKGFYCHAMISIKHWIDRFFQPRLDWIQIEISSLCTASCIYCPHTVLRPIWKHGSMSRKIFFTLLNVFQYTRYVHLQGWGEPFLHSHFFDFVQATRNTGCIIGTTTSGQTVTADIARRLVDEGPDVVAFSVAGCSELSDRYRRGTSFIKTLRAIETITNLKEKSRQTTPKIHVAYILLMSALDEVKHIISVFGHMGVQEVIISMLNFVIDPKLREESFLYCGAAKQRKAVEILQELIALSGTGVDPVISVNFSPFNQSQGCLENATRSIFISHDGYVHPCVYLGIPLISPTNGNMPPILQFVNLETSSFPSLWNHNTYRQWRRSQRQEVPPVTCTKCGRFVSPTQNRSVFFPL